MELTPQFFPPEIHEAFWDRVQKRGDSECWPWAGTIANRYGVIWFKGRARLAHRMAYAFRFGRAQSGMCICHHCDNPPCVNPAHLFEGSVADNNRDRDRKGRSVTGPGIAALRRENPRRGEMNGRSKLTEDQVLEIRRQAGYHGVVRQLAVEFSVSDGAISEIRNGKTWAHSPIPDEAPLVHESLCETIEGLGEIAVVQRIFREQLSARPVGDSFTIRRANVRRLYTAAKLLGVTVSTSKMASGGSAVWILSKDS